MRLSTTMPTGTFRSRKAINSVKVTRAPEKSARIHTLKKLITIMKNTNAISAATPIRTYLTVSILIPSRLGFSHDHSQTFDRHNFDRFAFFHKAPVRHHIYPFSIDQRRSSRTQYRLGCAGLTDQFRFFGVNRADLAM